MTPSSPLWSIQEWETDFFGIRTARTAAGRLVSEEEIDRIIAECRADNVQVIHSLADADDDDTVRLLEARGFHLVDVRVTLTWMVERGASLGEEGGVLVRAHHNEDVPALEGIAEGSYLDTRYFYDRRYPRERCAALYATWISRSCQGMAEQVLVAERDDDLVGYVSCHLPGDAGEGRIGLVGVARAARGLGVGQRLVGAAQRWFCERQASTVAVVTQARNVAAQRLYQRAGFMTSTVQLWYHLWLDR